MTRSILTFFLSLILAIVPIFFIPQKVDAVAVPVIRVVAGSTAEKALLGMAEKAGMKMANKTAQKRAVERWNLDLHEQYMKETIENQRFYDSVLDRLNSPPIPIPEKPGFGKIVVNTAMFLTGADLLYEGYKAYQEGVENEKAIQRVTTDINTPGEVGLTLGDWGFKTFSHRDTNNSHLIYFMPLNLGDEMGRSYGYQVQYGWGAVPGTASYYYKINDHGSSLNYEIEIVCVSRFSGNPDGPLYTNVTRKNFSKSDVINKPRVVESVPTVGTFPEPYSIPLILDPVLSTPLISPSEPYPIDYMRLPEEIEIEIPLEDPYPITSLESPLNTPLEPIPEPLPDLVPLPDPVPPVEPIPEPVSDNTVGILQQIYNFLVNYLGQLLKYLFIPSAPIDIEPVTARLEERIPIVPQMTSMVGALFGPGGECSVNDMYVTLFGKQMKVMDFSILRDASTTYLPWLRGFMWFLFFVWAIRKVNSMIAGRHGTK